MSAGLAGAVSNQRMKGQANSQGKYLSNGPKEHQQQQQQSEHGTGEEPGNFDSWRGGNNTQQHHSSYPIGTGDPYSPYYASTSFPYQTFGAGDGTWSNGTDPVTFLSGYGGQISHDAYGMDGGMFSANAGGGFSTFGQPAFNYFPGNGDFNAWGTPRKTRYDDYYQPRGNENYPTPGAGSGEMKTIEQSVQGLSIQSSGEPTMKIQEVKEPRKITWASVASQPAKPIPPLSSTQGMKKKAGMPPPPIVPGKHNMDIGTWGEGKSSAPPPPTAPPPPQIQSPVPPAPQSMHRHQRPPQTSCWNRQPPPEPQHPQQHHQQQQQQHQQQHPQQQHHQHQHQQQQQQQHLQPPQQQQQPQQSPQQQPPSSPPQSHSSHQQSLQVHHNMPPQLPPTQQQQQQQQPQQQQQQQQIPTQLQNHPVLDELKVKNDYNPVHFDLTAPGARFFVIKSYSEDDIHRSIKYEIWCSTEHGNKRLDQAYREVMRDGGPLYLFFSVNGSGHFCGMAQMMSSVDYNSNSSVWCLDKWKGQFRVRWIYVKDVPNGQLRHIKLENNDNQPVTKSRDAQEVFHAEGTAVLHILHSYRHTTSIFDDFGHYERKQAEEVQRKVPPMIAPNQHPHQHHHQQQQPHHANHRNRGQQASDLPREQHHYQRKDRDAGRGRGRVNSSRQ